MYTAWKGSMGGGFGERPRPDAGTLIRKANHRGATDRWKDKIREAIANGSFFICCFSQASGQRVKSVMYEELRFAVDDLRVRNPIDAWFIPVLFPGGEIPDWSIGGNENLRDFNYVRLDPDKWSVGIARLIETIQRSR